MRGRGDGRLARRPPAAGHGTYAPTRERGRGEGKTIVTIDSSVHDSYR